MNPAAPWAEIMAAYRRAWRHLADALWGVARLPGLTVLALLKGPANSQDAQAKGALEIVRDEPAIPTLEPTPLADQQSEDFIDEALLEQKLRLYRTLEPMLTQLPLARRAQALGKPLEAAHVLALYAPLEAALQELGFTSIGAVDEVLPFDPSCHQSHDPSCEPGQPIAIKQPGYRLGTRILRRARVVAAGF
jgi:hypothetical protein